MAWRPSAKRALARRAAEALTALVWLTRYPVGRFLRPPVPQLASAVWAFPLAGLALALPASVPLLAGLPAPVAAILAVGVMVWLTGAMHEDGLADYTDGCGGATRERRLEIMRDSRIGSYGVLALLLVTGLRIASLAELARISPWAAAGALAVAASLSRAGMGMAMAVMDPARPDGLGRAAGRASLAAAGWGWALAAAVVAPLILAGTLSVFAAIAAILACAAAQFLLGRGAQRRLGGQTGDVLGAMQQKGECATLLTLLILTSARAA